MLMVLVIRQVIEQRRSQAQKREQTEGSLECNSFHEPAITRVRTFQVCLPKHRASHTFNMQILAGQLHFLTNRDPKADVPPVNCIK